MLLLDNYSVLHSFVRTHEICKTVFALAVPENQKHKGITGLVVAFSCSDCWKAQIVVISVHVPSCRNNKRHRAHIIVASMWQIVIMNDWKSL
jgi:hypothetical protein